MEKEADEAQEQGQGPQTPRVIPPVVIACLYCSSDCILIIIQQNAVLIAYL